MKNKIVGIMVVIIALIVGGLTYYFNTTLASIHASTCSMGPTCSAYQEINFQLITGIVFVSLLVLVGLYLIFFGEEKVEIIRKIRIKTEKKAEEEKKDYSSITNILNADEKKIFNLVLESKGAIFQSELNEKSQFDKVKVTRILDRLEGQGLVERRRRGMTNVIILK